MDSINLRLHFSRNTLFRMLLLACVVAGIAYWKLDLINDFYFKNQLTQLGWVINGTILGIFLLGLLKIIGTLFVYMREEADVVRFVKNMEHRPDRDPLKGINKNSLMAHRYMTLRRLHESRTPINQNALASSLVASESTRSSLPKFISNILILMGVFGTIVSLSIALVGASDVLENAINTSGMGMVIHGMSTALSTTITAIICYLYFGYFYLRLTDSQTNLISAIEQITTTFLVPKFQVQTDSVLYEFTGLIRSLQGLVDQMSSSQKGFANTQQELNTLIDHYRNRMDSMDEHMNTIIHYLQLGFRLRDGE